MNIEKKTVYENGLQIKEDELPRPAAGRRLTMTVDGVETDIAAGSYKGRVVLEATEAYHRIGAFSMAGEDDFDYRAGLYVDENGIRAERSALSAIRGGHYSNVEADGIEIVSTSRDFNGVIVSGPIRYHIKNSRFSFPSGNDGRVGCDFTGYGAVIYALGGAEVVLENCEFYTEGVVRPCVYVDEHTNVIMNNCRYLVAGGTLFEEYKSNAETDKMVAAPWVLGIKGNCRGVNLMGFNSSLTIVDSHCAAVGWGVVSTDIGTNQKLTVIDSVLEVPLADADRNNPFLHRYGPGYGTYSTGDYANCREYFYGVHFKVGTYGTIINQGNATYASSAREICVECPDEYPGRELYRTKGKGQKTIIDSDGFGIMTHGSGSVCITEGTKIESDRATFLIRSEDVDICVEDGAELLPANGIILQMADNDDDLVGIANPDEPFGCTFNTEYREPEGWPSENGSVTGKGSGKGVLFHAENVALRGDFYNGTGYYGKSGNSLKVTLARGASLEGDISATETRHTDEAGNQKTSFTSEEYYYIGSVHNRLFLHEHNRVSVFLSDDARWQVRGRCLLHELVIMDQAQICAPEGKELTVLLNGAPLSWERNRVYKGNIELSVE